ncbi:HPP family protein [Rhodobacter sp. NSM]|uniref:HPP family protein n=1 Tax=Rhodobacter sp. NSM TaxID=3457501 RepID=UPI003FD6B8BE
MTGKADGKRLSRVLKPLGPAIPAIPLREVLRTAGGITLALGLLAAFVLPPHVDLDHGFYLVAPLAASSVLLFALPNSPLAQPWSVLVGNVVSALAAVAMLHLVPGQVMGLATAVGAAIFAMMALRALHPPGAAVAMTAALNPEATRELGYHFALAPVGLGTAALILLAFLYARLTGRVYPMRQPRMPNGFGTRDRPAPQRLGLGAEELEAILRENRQQANLGPEDLSRLIAAAEQQAAGRRLSTIRCAELMAQDLVTVAAETPVAEVARIFRQHRFTSIPVTEQGRLLGLIFPIHLIGAAPAAQAADVMERDVPHVHPATDAGALLPILGEGRIDAIPVVEDDRLVGIVTRTDLVAAMAAKLRTTG